MKIRIASGTLSLYLHIALTAVAAVTTGTPVRKKVFFIRSG